MQCCWAALPACDSWARRPGQAQPAALPSACLRQDGAPRNHVGVDEQDEVFLRGGARQPVHRRHRLVDSGIVCRARAGRKGLRAMLGVVGGWRKEAGRRCRACSALPPNRKPTAAGAPRTVAGAGVQREGGRPVRGHRQGNLQLLLHGGQRRPVVRRAAHEAGHRARLARPPQGVHDACRRGGGGQGARGGAAARGSSGATCEAMSGGLLPHQWSATQSSGCTQWQSGCARRAALTAAAVAAGWRWVARAVAAHPPIPPPPADRLGSMPPRPGAPGARRQAEGGRGGRPCCR